MKIIFQILEIFFGYLGSYSTKKRNIFIFYVIGTIFSALMFWSVGNYAAILPVLTTGIRYFVFIYKDKYKTELPLIGCLIMHFVVLFISTKTLTDMIPSALVIIGCLIYWYLDKEKLKAAIFLINIPWILYYIFCGLEITAINATIQTILVGIAYLKLSNRKKIFLSINNNFFQVKPELLINLIKKYDKNNLIYGFEVATGKEDEKYVKEFASEAHKKGYRINLHSLPFKDKKEIEDYLKFAVEISKIMKEKVNIVYHPEECSNFIESIQKTEEMIKQIYKIINDNNYSRYIELSIENLNILNDNIRLKKEDLLEILKKENQLKFTYDIGHETVDNIKTNELNELLQKRLNNIHIHAHEGKIDHYPIKDFSKEIEITNLLKKYGKRNRIVMEYSLDYIEGSNLEEKIKNYISYAKEIKF